MTINEKNEEYRKKHWNPKWASLPQEEKLKDPEFVKYLYGLIKLGLDFFKEPKEKGSTPEVIELADTMIVAYEELLKYFSVVEENK